MMRRELDWQKLDRAWAALLGAWVAWIPTIALALTIGNRYWSNPGWWGSVIFAPLGLGAWIGWKVWKP